MLVYIHSVWCFLSRLLLQLRAFGGILASILEVMITLFGLLFSQGCLFLQFAALESARCL